MNIYLIILIKLCFVNPKTIEIRNKNQQNLKNLRFKIHDKNDFVHHNVFLMRLEF